MPKRKCGTSMREVLHNTLKHAWVPIHAGILVTLYSAGAPLPFVVCCVIGLWTAYNAGKSSAHEHWQQIFEERSKRLRDALEKD